MHFKNVVLFANPCSHKSLYKGAEQASISMMTMSMESGLEVSSGVSSTAIRTAVVKILVSQYKESHH